jgi:alpha-1,6-mannosyltransferase
MKIVDVCAFYSPQGGGVKTYIGQKLAIAERLGHDITVLAPGDVESVIAVSPNARIRTLASPRFQLHAALDDLNPDFVEASSVWRSPLMVAEWRPAVPKALIMHADPLAAYAYRWLEPLLSRSTIDRRLNRFWDHLRNLGRMYDVVICASQDLASRMQQGGVANVLTVPMGIEANRFSAGRRDPELRTSLLAQCGLGPDATLLVSAGRLAPEKRLPMLIDAVTTAGQHRPVALAIFGEGREYNHVIRAIAGNPHVRLFRPERDRERFATLLASCDALLHGCEAETFCMTAAEASASGVPVIVPDRGGASDFAQDGMGIYYQSADCADLVRAILELPQRFVPPPGPSAVRSMDDHFAALFAIYEQLRQTHASRAA